MYIHVHFFIYSIWKTKTLCLATFPDVKNTRKSHLCLSSCVRASVPKKNRPRERPTSVWAVMRQATSKTNDVAGDGTTTATLLVQAMVTSGLKHLAGGSNPVELKSGMEKATEHVVGHRCWRGVVHRSLRTTNERPVPHCGRCAVPSCCGPGGVARCRFGDPLSCLRWPTSVLSVPLFVCCVCRVWRPSHARGTSRGGGWGGWGGVEWNGKGRRGLESSGVGLGGGG